MLYQAVPFDANFDSVFVQSATAPGLMQAVNSAISALVAATRRVVGLALAGAGDGHTFVVQIDHVAGAPTGTVEAFFFEAANKDTLRLAFEDIASSFRAAGLSAIDQQIAGASQGTRFMGMLVLATAGTFPGLSPVGGGMGFAVGAAVNVPDTDPFGPAFFGNPNLVLDVGTSPVFAIGGAGPNAGKLVYTGPSLAAALISYDIDFLSKNAIAANITFDLAVTGGAWPANHIYVGAPATATAMIQSVAAAYVNPLPNGATLDIFVNGVGAGGADVYKYHISVDQIR